MGELSKQLLAWMARLLPKQKVQGDGAFQVGKVGGNVTIVNHHHALPPPKMEAKAPGAGLASPEQREVLKLIRDLPDERSTYKFMREQFRTEWVVDLDSLQLHRLRRYVQAIHAVNAEKQQRSSK